VAIYTTIMYQATLAASGMWLVHIPCQSWGQNLPIWPGDRAQRGSSSHTEQSYATE